MESAINQPTKVPRIPTKLTKDYWFFFERFAEALATYAENLIDLVDASCPVGNTEQAKLKMQEDVPLLKEFMKGSSVPQLNDGMTTDQCVNEVSSIKLLEVQKPALTTILNEGKVETKEELLMKLDFKWELLLKLKLNNLSWKMQGRNKEYE